MPLFPLCCCQFQRIIMKKKNRGKFLLALVVWNALTTQDIFILLCSGCSRANTADLYQISLESLALTVYGQYPEGIF